MNIRRGKLEVICVGASRTSLYRVETLMSRQSDSRLSGPTQVIVRNAFHWDPHQTNRKSALASNIAGEELRNLCPWTKSFFVVNRWQLMEGSG